MRKRIRDLAGFRNPRGLSTWIVLALMLLYIVTFSAISIRQHDAFLTHKEDLGQIDQAVWNSLHGRVLVETDEDHQSTRLTDHVEPVLIASSLVFLIWDDVRALLALQAVAAALGTWAVFLLARDVFVDGGRTTADGRRQTADGKQNNAGHCTPSIIHRPLSDLVVVAFALLYLLYPALEAAHLAEFHAAPLAAAPIAFALLFLERRQWLRFLLATLLVSAVKEEMALVGVMLGAAGVMVVWRDESGRQTVGGGRRQHFIRSRVRATVCFHPSSIALLASLSWFVLATFVIVPHFGAGKYASADSVYFQRFGELGATPTAVAKTLLTNPALVARVLLTAERIGYIGGLFASVGFLALAAPELLLLSTPLLAANLLSNFPAQFSGDFHYSAPLAPFFVVAAIYGFERITHGLSLMPFAQWGLLLGVLLCSLIFHHARGYAPLSENFYWPDVTPHDEHFARFAAQIPRDARLSATPPLFPHLSHREVIYVFPTVADADYILLDVSGVTDMHPNDVRSAVNALLVSKQFGVLDSADGYLLLRRSTDATQAATLPNAFYDFARAPNAQPQYRTAVVFGDALKLVGYDIVADARWHRVQTRWYWQALRPLDADLRVYPFYHDASGRIIEDTSQRPMVATLWHPLTRWQTNEIVVTETVLWDVGDTFGLAVGVMHGSDWDRHGKRLSTSTGESQIELGTFAWRAKQLERVSAPN